MFQTNVAAEVGSGRSRLRGICVAVALCAALKVSSAAAQASQDAAQPAGTTQQGPQVKSTAKLEQGPAASYDNKYEVYGGLSFMNGQAGQNLPKRYNLGGGEVMGTYWIKPKLGIAADYRLELGTTPLFPNPYYNRVLVYQNIYSGGVQYRGPKNRYAAIDFHALAGAAHGTFDHAIQNYPGGSPVSATGLGLYPNGTTGWGAAGGSLDFNYSAKLAIRLSPDIIFEHYGTETREFVSVSAGLVYRVGHK